MALPVDWRIHTENTSGITLTDLEIKVRFWKFDSVTGQISFSAEATLMDEATVADNDIDSGTAQSNDDSTSQWLGFFGRIRCNGSTGTVDGVVSVWLQPSNDGTNWPANTEGFLVAAPTPVVSTDKYFPIAWS
jgi:hypothetical protein